MCICIYNILLQVILTHCGPITSILFHVIYCMDIPTNKTNHPNNVESDWNFNKAEHIENI